MSRIDRALISEEWLAIWPNSTLWGLKRTISDHCPILLKDVEVDWGPKPFKVLDCWFDHKDYKKFVEQKFSSYNIEGWGAFVVKEKIKMMKKDLKEWNREVFGNVENRIEFAKQTDSRP